MLTGQGRILNSTEKVVLTYKVVRSFDNSVRLRTALKVVKLSIFSEHMGPESFYNTTA